MTRFLTPHLECKVTINLKVTEVYFYLGWRTSMEDSHIADLEHLGDGKYIFGVFDGHGGKYHFYNNHF